MSNHQEDTQMTHAELERIVAETDFAATEARVAADQAVSPRGFTVRRFSDRVRVTHNRTQRERTFHRDSDRVSWSRPSGVRGHRSDGESSVESVERFGVEEGQRAAAWFHQAVENGTAFVEDQD